MTESQDPRERKDTLVGEVLSSIKAWHSSQYKKITFLRNDLYKIKCMLFYVILGGIGVQGPPGDVGPAGPKGEIGEPGGNQSILDLLG